MFVNILYSTVSLDHAREEGAVQAPPRRLVRLHGGRELLVISGQHRLIYDMYTYIHLMIHML